MDTSEATVVPEEEKSVEVEAEVEVKTEAEPVVEVVQEPPVDLNSIDGAPWIMITGMPGSGKTSLAATIPDAYCLDTEPPGAASAFRREYRKPFQFSPSIFEDVEKTVVGIVSGTKKEGRYLVGTSGTKISALVIDTFSTMQKVLINKYLAQKRRPNSQANLIWAPSMEQRDWGILLNYQTNLVAALKSLQIPVVLVCHSKVYEPQYDGYGDRLVLRKQGHKGLDIAGSIEEFIVNLCDYILHITVVEEGRRLVYTQSTVVEDSYILAKDRHTIFKNSEHDWTSFELKAEHGRPKTTVLKYICERHNY